MFQSISSLLIATLKICISFCAQYMWKMAQVFKKRLKYVGNEVDMREMAKINGK